MSEEETVAPKVGDAMAEAEAEPAGPPPGSRVAAAHYGGKTEQEAFAVFREETLCSGCASAGVCRVVHGAQDVLAVVSRCLAFLPLAG